MRRYCESPWDHREVLYMSTYKTAKAPKVSSIVDFVLEKCVRRSKNQRGELRSENNLTMVILSVD